MEEDGGAHTKFPCLDSGVPERGGVNPRIGSELSSQAPSQTLCMSDIDKR